MLYDTIYQHGGDVYGGGIRLDFSANTNPFGTPQGVMDAIAGSLVQLHQYPDPYCRELVETIGAFEQVPREWILCGSGAAELIYSYCEGVRPATALELAPTFSEYGLALDRVGCKSEHYDLRKEDDFALTADFLDALSAKKPEAVFLCNPNNPTGKLIPPELLEKILAVCEETSARLFVDECFLDLSENGVSMKPFLAGHPGLFLLKAFTKSYGMAGVRLGYCLCSDSALLTKMSRSVQPWNVSTVAQKAGVAALKEREFLRKTNELIRAERPWLKENLEKLGLYVCDSRANYLLFQGPEDLREKLMARGIAIRGCGNYPGLGKGWFRVAVRTHLENEALMDAIRQEV